MAVHKNPGNNVTIDVTLTNTGNVSYNFYINCSITGLISFTHQNVTMNPGDQKTVEFASSVPNSPGTYDVYASAGDGVNVWSSMTLAGGLVVDSTTPVIVDSYNESNYNVSINMYQSYITVVGQSFMNTNACVLDNCKFYLAKNASPTGTLLAMLWTHSGTYGFTSVPGSFLVYSDPIAASSLSTNPQLITFNFTGSNRVNLAAGTPYIIAIQYIGGGDANNYVAVALDSTSPTHSGNFCCYYTMWSSVNVYDTIFYVYGVPLS